MSRVSPFPTAPTRRAKSPAPGPTQPLSINRPASRPVTPGASSSTRPAAISSPARPVRSDLRSRVTSQTTVSHNFGNFAPDAPNPAASQANNNVPGGASSRDSGDGPYSFNEPIPRNRLSRPARSADRPISTVRVDTDSEPPQLSPQQMNALNAFRQAGQRRARRDDERDLERQKEKELEIARQRKLKERTLGRRTPGKAKAGDIDGTPSHVQYLFQHLNQHLAVLDDVEAEWSSLLDSEVRIVY